MTYQVNSFTEYEITDLKNLLKPYLLDTKIDFILKSIQVRQHLELHISKIDKWLEQYRQGTNDEMKRKPQVMKDEIWFDIQERRYEYLESLSSILQFMINYPESEQII